MTYYIDPTNEIFGFDDTQKNLIPSDAVAIPNKYTPDQYAFLSLTGGKIVFESAAYNAATQTNTIAQSNNGSKCFKSFLSNRTSMNNALYMIENIIKF